MLACLIVLGCLFSLSPVAECLSMFGSLYSSPVHLLASSPRAFKTVWRGGALEGGKSMMIIYISWAIARSRPERNNVCFANVDGCGCDDGKTAKY